jgi:hypothetical protein
MATWYHLICDFFQVLKLLGHEEGANEMKAQKVIFPGSLSSQSSTWTRPGSSQCPSPLAHSLP